MNCTNLIAALFLSLPLMLHAASIEQDKGLPSLIIDDKGEIFLVDEGTEFKIWNSDNLTGKLHILHYMSANISGRAINKDFTDATKTLLTYGDKYLITTILNLDDAYWGTSSFVIHELKKNKEKYPYASLVVDKEAYGRKHWSLQKNSSNIAVINKKGKVIFFKEGPLSEEEVKSTIKLIEDNM